MDTQLDLPLLEALLLGGEVVHIRIGQVVCLAEKRVAAALDDDPLRQIVQLLVGISHEAGIKHVVIVPAAVEAHEPELEQLLDLRRLRVDHPDDRLALALDLPVDEEEIREDLHVVEYEFRVVVFDVLRRLLRLERHLVDQFDAVVCLMGAACSESQDSITHVRHVIRDTAAIGLLENLIDEVDARLRVRMILAVKILLDHRPEHLLILNTFEVHHLFVSFQWQPRADRCDRQVVAFCQFPAQRALACENFHFDLVVIDTGELLRIPCVNIMQVDACSRFTELCVSRRPFARLFEIGLEVLVSVLIRNIEVDYDVVFGDSDVVEGVRVNTTQSGSNAVPRYVWGSIVFGVLCWTVSADTIKDRFLSIEDKV